MNVVVNKNTHPERSLYYLGALLLEVLSNSEESSVDFLDAFRLLNEKEGVSMNLFVLTVDWLYLLGTIESEKGVLVRCF